MGVAHTSINRMMLTSWNLKIQMLNWHEATLIFLYCGIYVFSQLLHQSYESLFVLQAIIHDMRVEGVWGGGWGRWVNERVSDGMSIHCQP